jgi:hypothetical protein
MSSRRPYGSWLACRIGRDYPDCRCHSLYFPRRPARARRYATRRYHVPGATASPGPRRHEGSTVMNSFAAISALAGAARHHAARDGDARCGAADDSIRDDPASVPAVRTTRLTVGGPQQHRRHERGHRRDRPGDPINPARCSQANAAIQRLASAGILPQTNVGRRNRAFEAPEISNAFTDLERHDSAYRLAAASRTSRARPASTLGHAE